jgi:cyclopropane-fatty-acyl-phospholipid synthase
VDGSCHHTFGDCGSELQTTIVVTDRAFYRRVVLGGSLGAAESLMEGQWTCDDLTTLVRIFIRNLDQVKGLDLGWNWLRQKLALAGNRLRRNSRGMARANIREHYDLGNDFFRLFLDETLCYSCGVFERDGATLREASIAKIERACGKLDLQRSDHLLEIGTGWGALASHAARRFGCQVTTTTISAEQHRFASEQVRSQGLEDHVTVLKKDYRDLHGLFDKLVSIEMIEAVGHQYLDTFFKQCSRLLRPDGIMTLQAIVIKDQAHQEHLRSVDFIGKYIFPGGCLPSVASICQSLARSSDFRVLHLEELSVHYVATLRAWRDRFWDNIAAVRALGFGEQFIRMWNYYFCYCEAAFLERRVNVVLMTLGKPDCRVDTACFIKGSHALNSSERFFLQSHLAAKALEQ